MHIRAGITAAALLLAAWTAGARDMGVVYGESLYLIGCEELRENDAAFFWTAYEPEPLSLGEETYRFSVAVEPSCPVMDDDGLTGSSVRGMPVLYREEECRAFPLLVPGGVVPGVLFRERETDQYWFRLIDDSGLGEKVSRVEVVEHRTGPALRVTVEYTTQEGGGRYTVTARRDGDHLVVIRHEHLSGTPY